jgi:hypothetical protein
MPKKTDFSNCPLFKKQPCPGFIGGYEDESSGTFYKMSEDQSINVFDFIRVHDYKCTDCPVNKEV